MERTTSCIRGLRATMNFYDDACAEEIKRPQNFCFKDETFEMKYFDGHQKVLKSNLRTNVAETYFFKTEKINFRLIYKDNATIVILEDGSKGVSKCHPNDIFSRREGLKRAYARAMICHYRSLYGE